LAAPSLLGPVTQWKQSGRFARAKAREREVEEGEATGVSEARSHRAPREQQARAHETREMKTTRVARDVRFVCDDDPPKR
jgi:hypothetical protein